MLEVEVKTTIGVGVGIESFLTTSDGERVHNPQYFRESEKKLTNTPETPAVGTEARNFVRPVGRTLQTSNVSSGRGN
ncbi:transposase [Candidatus Poribacteria bacterium]|nr:transposase [Candidatus Poribacteria bacterium]